MTQEYLVHIRGPMNDGQRAALLGRFPARRHTARPQFLFLGCDAARCRPREMVDYARTLGLEARVVEL